MTRTQMLLCTLLALPVAAGAQVVAPEQPSSRMKTAPGAATPGDAGSVVVPPKTDSAAVATPPAHVDPGINAANDGVDARNEQKSQDKKTDLSKGKRADRSKNKDKDKKRSE